jgi:hypothetical protein
MQYYDGSEDRLEKIGHALGDVFSACIYVFVIVLMLSHFVA